MKIFFSIMLIFLFLSCGGGKKTPESVVPDKDSESDGDITGVDESDDEVTDTCETEPCKGVENSTGECIDEDKGYSCECLEKYGWSPDDKKCLEIRTAECTGLPENAEWHGPTSITQMTRDGEEWFPSTEGTYRMLGECKDSCCFRCIENYTWFDNECLDPDTIKGQCSARPCKNMKNSTGVCTVEDEWPWYSCECAEGYTFVEITCGFGCRMTRTAECTGLPEHAEWNEVSSIMQKSEDGEYWSPETTGRWNYTPCTTSCCFQCIETYFWNGSECVNLCDQEPCSDEPHSTGECFSVGPFNYTCGCEEGYYWWGEKRGCLAKKPDLGNICTGLHDCFDNNKKIDCPVSGEDFYGQDANYAEAGMCAWHDFAVNIEFPEEPTVLNRNTGLEWTQHFFTEPWEEAIDYCENLTYAGKSDWRLPTMREIFSIHNEIGADNLPSLHGIYFPKLYTNTAFWSSDSCLSGSDQAWASGVVGHGGLTYKGDKTKKLNFLCVRGEKSPAPVFEVSTLNGDKVVTDTATGLVWQKDYVLKGEWKQALNYCESLVYAGYSDWRLPNRNEILSLIDYGKYKPASDFSYIIGESTDSFYLFSSTSSSWFKNVETVFAVDGKIVDNGKAETNYYQDRNVHCVRSDLCGEGLFLKGSECVLDPCSPELCEMPGATGLCIPKTTSAYECQCLEGFFWNGSKCVDPCAADPCSKVANSNGNCTAINSNLYFCGCNKGFGWKSGKCESFASGVATLGNICIGTETITLPFPEMLKCKAQDFELKTVSDQEIVVDKNTGLEWQHAVSEKTYTWNEALAYCENLEYAGFSDWRLPEPLEILTIVNHGVYDIDADAYNDTPQLLVNELSFESVFPSFDVGNNLWTSETYRDDPKRAWVFSPQRSYVYSNPSKTNIYNAMCVRGGILPRAEFKKSENGGDAVVTDSATGFMWQQGFTVMEDVEHSNAIEYCDDLTYAGYSDWRLPNKNELASLFSFDTTFSDFFDMPAKYDFISSTTFVLNATYPGEPFLIVDEKAMTINQKGEVGYVGTGKESIMNYPEMGSYNVRCVRDYY